MFYRCWLRITYLSCSLEVKRSDSDRLMDYSEIFHMDLRSPPYKYKENIFHCFSQSTMQIQGEYFSLFFAVHHANTRRIFFIGLALHHANTGEIIFMYFRSPPCIYRAIYFMGFRSSLYKYKDIIFHCFSQSTMHLQGQYFLLFSQSTMQIQEKYFP